MAEDFEREEKAFTAALRNAADAESFRPLDPGEFTTAPERVRPPNDEPGAEVLSLSLIHIYLPRTRPPRCSA